MANSKTIEINKQFNLSNGELNIKSIPGDAHLTTSRIYRNYDLISNGVGETEVITAAQSGDKIYLITTINKPQGSSDYASISIELEDDLNSDSWVCSSAEPDYDEVIFEVSITLTSTQA